MHIPVARGWVAGGLTASESPFAGVLLLPPFFHEWQRCYRLFALLADALSHRGVAMLRFDYRGTGESSGNDSDFLPSRALEDADAALTLLRSRCRGPVIILGVRAGALLAERIAARHTLPWWAWQGIDDGATYFETLRQRHRREINSRSRYPFLVGKAADDPNALMGHHLHAEFGLELGIFKRTTKPAWRLDVTAGTSDDTLALPPEFSEWVDQIDLQGVLPLAAVSALADRFLERLQPTNGAAA